MLRIRPEQMEALERDSRRRRVARLAKKVAGRCSARATAVTHEEFEELVRQGVEKAEGYHIDEEADLERFLVCLLGNSSTFEVDEGDPEVQEILNDPDMEGEDKLDELDDFYASRGEG